MAEHEALQKAKAEVESQLADAQNSLAKLTAQRDVLEVSLLSTKATLKSTEESLKTANVSRIQDCPLKRSTCVHQPAIVSPLRKLMDSQPGIRNLIRQKLTNEIGV